MKNIIILIVAAVVIVGAYFLYTPTSNDSNIMSSNQTGKFVRYSLDTNTDKTDIDLDLVLSGGPGKDGIPAINNPKFTSASEANFADDSFGVFVDIDGVRRFYPYPIIVWHEIVNDSIGDNNFAITFCPLCGTAIAFNREVDGNILQFGVSGLLFESNLLMYDIKTESLWSQARGRVVVGDLLGTELDIIPIQLITFKEVKEKYPDVKVLSKDTGYGRNYDIAPYSGYEDTDRLYFPVSVSDKRLPTKEIMYVVPFEDKSFSFTKDSIPAGETTIVSGGDKLRIVKDGGEIEVFVNDEFKPGYFEMWFSWATHHQEDGVLLEI